MTCSFFWTGEYNTFNDGGFVTRDPTVVVVCTLLSLYSCLAFGAWLFFAQVDDVKARLLLFVGSLGMLLIAIVFVIGGVWIMILDIAIMGYYSWITWEHYQAGLLIESQFA